jgi:curved DNA-binding protein
MEYKDYYKVLGVPKTANEQDIKAAYRKLARKYHPDMNKGDKKAEARFKEINEANEVLSDPEKRKRYDQLGSDWASYNRPGAAGPAEWTTRTRTSEDFGEGNFGGFSDFFRTFFSGGGFSGGGGFGTEPFESRAGADVEDEIQLTLDEVAKGTTRQLQITDGRSTRKVEVKIPAGVREGSRVRVAGEGASGPGGRRGDLYLRVRLRPHPTFERKGDDLLTTVKVPLTTAVLAGEAMVPTLEGPVGIKIPPGSQPGQTFRLRGHGLPRLESGGGRGDVLATLNVELPRKLGPRERELFEELRKLGH